MQFFNLNGVHGIAFSGNDFINTASLNYPWYQRGKGIVSTDASFTVKPLCYTVPCLIPDKNTFEGLDYAVDASAINPLIPVNITECTFTNNFRGVTVKGINNISVSGSTFDVGSIATAQDVPNSNITKSLLYSFGIYLEGCAGYSIHSNTFTTTHDAPYGLIVNNSGSNDNLVFGNAFSNFKTAACQAQGTNGSKNLAEAKGTGLVFALSTARK